MWDSIYLKRRRQSDFHNLLQSSFFASFMCFEVQPLTPQASGDVDKVDDDDITAMDIDGSDIKASEYNFPIYLTTLDAIEGEDLE